MAKKKNPYSYSYGYGYWYTGYNNSYWGDIYSRYSSRFASGEEKRKFKKTVKEKARARYLPVEVYVWTNNEFFKKAKMSIRVNQSDMKSLESKIDTILDAFDKFSYKSDIADSEAFKLFLWLDNVVVKFISDNAPGTVSYIIQGYFNWKIWYEQYRSIFDQKKINEKWNGVKSSWLYAWWGEVWKHVSLSNSMYSKNLRIIQSKISIRDDVYFEENLRKGKRINRNFLTGSSYKPLMSKTVESKKNKKIMFIVDCSGSMDCKNVEKNHIYDLAWCFVAASVNAWIFDCEQVILHSSWGWENVAPKYKKWQLFTYCWTTEWFEHLEDNLDPKWAKEADYVILITDLDIWVSAEEWVYSYLKNCKKHMVLSFAQAWTLQWMNVRKVSKPHDMINALVSIVS